MGTNHISFYVLILTKYTRKRKDEYLWQFIQECIMERNNGNIEHTIKLLMGLVSRKILNGLIQKKKAVLEESVFIQRKKDEPYCNLTFKEVCDLWMEQNYRRLKPTTCYTKKVYINMLSPFHDIKIENIKSVDVDTFFESKKSKS